MIGRIARFVLGIALVLLLVGGIMPWLAEHGYAGRLVQTNYREGRDASPMFYSDSEEVMALLKRMSDE
ncbi:MAG: hypothetical protein GC168_11770 [Candidatus Hydrogenedens sp.]|nr:hypothetical protein [Candidatus Hydrogenedens sp.]